MIAVIDYGLGNLRSVSKALEGVGAKVEVTNNLQAIAKAKAIVLPGVGAFHRGMENLNRLNLISVIYEVIGRNIPFLGICLGMQLLFTEGEEQGLHKGLEVIKGRVKKFDFRDERLKIPHMGWNQIKLQAASYKPQAKNKKPAACSLQLFRGIPDGSYYYFVHSYYVELEDENIILATTEYGMKFTSAIAKGNVFGVQFHPEKSADLGLTILKNFISLC